VRKLSRGACYNRGLVMNPVCLNLLVMPEAANLPGLLRDWREDTMTFLRHDVPKLALVLLGAFLLVRLLRVIVRKVAGLEEKRLLPGMRAQQVRTLASVINGVGVFVILFVAALEALSLLGLNLGPLLASAGIAGLAIGFGAQTLVKDVINGFFILFEDQYNIGDTVRAAGVKGVVEALSLRRTVLRDDDGTVHIVPNSEIKIVSNQTRDWAQVTLRVTVAYSEPSDRIVTLLQQVGSDLRNDPAFTQDILSEVQVLGLERVGQGEAEYMMVVKTRPNQQYGVSRELRRRIKDSFQKNKVQAGGLGRVYVMDQGPGAQAS